MKLQIAAILLCDTLAILILKQSAYGERTNTRGGLHELSSIDRPPPPPLFRDNAPRQIFPAFSNGGSRQQTSFPSSQSGRPQSSLHPSLEQSNSQSGHPSPAEDATKGSRQQTSFPSSQRGRPQPGNSQGYPPPVDDATGGRRQQTPFPSSQNGRPQPGNSQPGYPSIATDATLSKMANTVNEFGFSLFKNIPQKNLFFSPLGISLAMGMVYAGAQRETAEEMAKVLGYKSSNLQRNEVAEGFRQLMNYLNGKLNGNELNIANGVFFTDRASLLSTYENTLKKYYDAVINTEDFVRNGEEVRRKINAWIENKTKGNIREFYPRPLQRDTILALVNAVYFKGKWAKLFNRNNTQNDIFYNNGNYGVTVPMMFQSTKLKHGRYADLGMNVIMIPYERNEFDMVIILPEGKNIQEIANSLNPSILDRILDNTEERELRLALPKFTLQGEYDLQNILQAMGITKLFSKQQAELTGISTNFPLFVSKVSHKSKLDVNEEGTVATGVTGIDIVPLSLPELFKVDHPFLFLIRERQSKVVLFMGQVNEL